MSKEIEYEKNDLKNSITMAVMGWINNDGRLLMRAQSVNSVGDELVKLAKIGLRITAAAEQIEISIDKLVDDVVDQGESIDRLRTELAEQVKRVENARRQAAAARQKADQEVLAAKEGADQYRAELKEWARAFRRKHAKALLERDEELERLVRQPLSRRIREMAEYWYSDLYQITPGDDETDDGD